MRNDYVCWIYTPYAGVAQYGDLIAVYKMFPGGLDLDPSLFFIPPMRSGLRDHHFKVMQGPSRRLRRKPSFSTRVVKYWNRLPTPIEIALSVNSFKRQLDSAWEELFAEVPLFPVFLFSPLRTPNSAIPFYIIPISDTPTPNSLSFIIVLTLFCIILPY